MRISSLTALLMAVSSTSAFTMAPNTMSGISESSLRMSVRENHDEMDRRSIFSSTAKTIFSVASLMVAGESIGAQPAFARLEAVNRPDLLPSESGLNVIQTEKFLTSGQEKRMNGQLAKLEQDTGFRVRVLCQAYPNTPGLAIRDYWDLGKEVSLFFLSMIRNTFCLAGKIS